MAHIEKQQACQLFIEQEIERGITEGKTPYSVAKEILPWINKLFNVSLKQKTIEKRAERYSKNLPTFVGNSNETFDTGTEFQDSLQPSETYNHCNYDSSANEQLEEFNDIDVSLPIMALGEKEILEKAKEIRDEIRQKRKEERISDIIKQAEAIEDCEDKPDGLFNVICIDPPWPYGGSQIHDDYDPFGRRAANPYPEMSLEEIKNIDLPATDDCIMWFWTTHKYMRHSFDIIDDWGFRDVAILTWAKDRIGLGSWLRSKSEFCIMCVKGKPVVNLTNQSTVISGPLREHSRKPDEFYEMVNELCVGRKLDYFSREKREGWDVFGNDADRFSR